MVNATDFQEWLKSELEKRSWSQSELGRASHFTRQAINAVLKYRRSPGFDLCLGIAHAFNLSPQEVLVRAHLMNPPPKYDPDTARILHKIAELKPEYLTEFTSSPAQSPLHSPSTTPPGPPVIPAGAPPSRPHPPNGYIGS